MNNKVILKDIPGFEDIYQISSDGNVFNKKTGRKLKNNLTTYGRNNNAKTLSIVLCKDGKRKNFHIGTLVGLAFIKNNKCFGFMHKDGNRLNNNIDNLEPYAKKRNLILHLPNGTSKKFKSLQAASRFLGKNVAYLSIYLTRHNYDTCVISNNKFICEIEFIEDDLFEK